MHWSSASANANGGSGLVVLSGEAGREAGLDAAQMHYATTVHDVV